MSGLRPRVASRGLTLIESVIASAILAVAITAVFSAVASGRAHADLAAEDLAATVAAAPPTKRRRTELSSAPATSCGVFEVQCEVRWGEER